LPRVCAYCGAPSTAQRKMPFVGRTPLTITGGGPYVARLPVCDRHRWHWLLRHLPEAAAFAIAMVLACCWRTWKRIQTPRRRCRRTLARSP
jgi:hypothetical protein